MLPAIDYFCRIKTRRLNPKKIVITGGPGTGKSSVIHELEAAGHYCFHEVIRSMTLEAKKVADPRHFVSNPLAFVPDPDTFNQRIIEARLRHYRAGQEVARQVVFYDRGIPDVLAYMDFFGQPYNSEYIAACQGHRYDKVLLLPPWEAIYISDNERLESFEESLEIHSQLLATYERFGYAPVLVPEGSVKDRAAHILLELTREKYL